MVVSIGLWAKKYRHSVRNVAMVCVAAVALGSSTYAWFAANTTVTATGMEVKATTTSNLLIAEDTLESNAKKTDENFGTSIALTMGEPVVLQPVSTIDGTAFYYTGGTNVKGNGDAINDTYVLLTGDTDTNFKNNYNNNNAKGYVDYVFQLKAINSFGEAAEIRLTKLDLKYHNTDMANQDTSKAYRVAVFSEDISNNNPAGSVGTLNKIYTESGAIYYTPGKAVDSTSTLGTVSTSNTVIVSMDSDETTGMYKVVVRLWLEGEDTTCTTNTFMDLTEKWSMDIELQLVDTTATPTESVPYITKTNSVTGS